MPIIPEQIASHLLIWAVALFIIKHLLADFLLQTSWMAKGKELASGWLGPLLAHVALHARVKPGPLVLRATYWGEERNRRFQFVVNGTRTDDALLSVSSPVADRATWCSRPMAPACTS